jgi:hypothetical protein
MPVHGMCRRYEMTAEGGRCDSSSTLTDQALWPLSTGRTPALPPHGITNRLNADMHASSGIRTHYSSVWAR